ncbi:MAG: transporter substrate-binding domain-containing protein [Methyloprofundus sp.]|nr:transporter substrate-binding domain-containing protein [Methyloprofundus sp.]
MLRSKTSIILEPDLPFGCTTAPEKQLGSLLCSCVSNTTKQPKSCVILSGVIKYSFLRIILLFWICICPISSFAEAVVLAPDIQRIIQRGKLIVALHQENAPPFSMLKNGELTGVDVEIAQDIATKLQVPLEFNRQAKTYDEVVKFVAQGKADIAVSLISSSLHRAKFVLFTKPYLLLQQALLINRLGLAALSNQREHQDIRQVLNQPDVKIGTMRSTAYIDYAHADYPQATIIAYDSWEQIITDVKTGKLLAAFYDEIAINNWNKFHPEDSLFLKTKILTHRYDPLAIVVNQQDPLLLAWLNLYVSRALLDGYFQALQAKYF